MAVNESNKIGGEYGEIRSEFDVDAFNKWLERNHELDRRVRTPVVVKQFAVSSFFSLK